MKLADQFRALNSIPDRIENTTKLITALAVFSILAFLVAGLALLNSGVRHAN